jgi:hypothetical protein
MYFGHVSIGQVENCRDPIVLFRNRSRAAQLVHRTKQRIEKLIVFWNRHIVLCADGLFIMLAQTLSNRDMSPRSGRMTIAHRFVGGIRSPTNGVRETDG